MAIFSTLFVGPVTLYLYAAHPSWSWMYLVDPESVPSLSVLPVIAGQTVAVLLGWYVGSMLVRSGKERALVYGTAGTSVLTIVLLILGASRLGAYGSYSDYRNGEALDLMEVKLGYVLVAIGLGGTAIVVFLVLELLRDSRRVRAKN